MCKITHLLQCKITQISTFYFSSTYNSLIDPKSETIVVTAPPDSCPEFAVSDGKGCVYINVVPRDLH